MHEYTKNVNIQAKILSDTISEHVFYKFFLGGMPPDPPSSSMLRMLSVLCTLSVI